MKWKTGTTFWTHKKERFDGEKRKIKARSDPGKTVAGMGKPKRKIAQTKIKNHVYFAKKVK